MAFPAIDINAANHFLQLLGKNGDARFRAFPHKETPKEVKAALKARKPCNLKDLQLAQAAGLGGYLVVNRGGDNKASITDCIAYFAEFDGIPEAEQHRRIQQSGQPEPSAVVRTGGGSLHFYWLLSEPMRDTAQWQTDMQRLAAHLGSDPSINDPSRVMRLPGTWSMDGNQQPVAMVELIHESSARYTRDQIISRLPAPQQATRKAKSPQSPKHPIKRPAAASERTAERALDQLKLIPPRIPGTGTRNQYLRLLWGLAHILGSDDAGAVMASHSPEWAAVEDLTAKAAEAGGQITDGTFFELARSFGAAPVQATASPNTSTPQPESASQAEDLQSDDEDAGDLGGIAERLELNRRLAAGRAIFNLAQLLPADLAHAVDILQRPLPTDPLSAALPLVCGYSGLLKLGTRVSSSLGFEKPVNLFVASVLRTGLAKTNLKTTLVDAPAKDIRLELAREHSRAMENWKEQIKGTKSDERPPAPKPVFVHITDYTPAALYKQLQLNDERRMGQLILRDELSGLFGQLAADAKSGTGTADAQLLELFDGDGYTGLRVTEGARSFESCHVSLYGNVQPDVLKAAINGQDETGKFARFLFCRVPNRPLELRDDDPTPEEQALHAAAEQTLRDYAKRLYCLPPRTYHFSQPARVRFHAWFNKHQQRSLLPGTPKVVAALLGKTSAHALRLAGILHLLKVAAGELDTQALISPETVDVAMAIVDQLTAETEAFHEEEETGIDFMRHIHQLSLFTAAPVSRQDARDKGGREIRRELKANVFTQCIQELQRLGYGQIVQVRQLNGKSRDSYQAIAEMP